MAPQPRKQNPQHQPLTVALAKICKDYPAGPGIFNELLQNADDAGASTVEFILDTQSYSDAPVLAAGLAEFQGPALLAYNDAPFLEDDFKSLTSLGNSKKLQDTAATGKFGLGFSSVFNWTDCPSIISGSALLFLDPHHSWSRESSPPGGPEYDFPADAEDESMQNQLRPFSLVNNDWRRPFEGTIIRIPLRTASQASQSNIVQTPTTIDDIKSSMISFAQEIGSNGLIFLKSVERIVLSVDGNRVNEIQIINKNDLMEPKRNLKRILAKQFSSKDCTDMEIYHEVKVKHWSSEGEVFNVFGVLNLVAGSLNDESLQQWAHTQRLFPWVAIAVPLERIETGRHEGRLFCTLPLPISTGLPVHIHGIFSLSADRSRLHGLDRGVSDQRPSDWNKLLFDQMIPLAWAKLLCTLSQRHPESHHFDLWPTNTSSAQELWHGVCGAVVTKIYHNKLSVWFTEVGYVSLEEGLLIPIETSPKLKSLFCEAKLPIIQVAKHLFDEVCQLAGDRNFHHRALCERLRQLENTNHLSKHSRLVLLEFLLSEMRLRDFEALNIIPLKDGTFRSLVPSPVFLHRDDFESILFVRDQKKSIDTDQLRYSDVQLLHQKVKQDNQLMRYRSTEDLRDFYLDHIAKGSDDILILGEQDTLMLPQIWKWILKYGEDGTNLTALGPLWLLPLRDGGVRKLVPSNSSSFITCFSSREENVALKLFSLDSKNVPKLLAEKTLSGEVKQRLLVLGSQEPSLHINDGDNFTHFLEFLEGSRTVLKNAPAEIKRSIFEKLRQLFRARDLGKDESTTIIFRNLCMFKAVRWLANVTDISPTRFVTDLSGPSEFIGMRKAIPLPPISGQIFLDATDELERYLLEEVAQVKCLNEVEVLEQKAVKAIQDGRYNDFAPELRREVTILLFENYYYLSKSTQGRLSSLAVVPLRGGGDAEKSSNFGCPLDCLDPQKSALVGIYSESERQYPEETIYNRFSNVLAACGMVRDLTERVIIDRIQNYQRAEFGFDQMAARARRLLQMHVPYDVVKSSETVHLIRQTKWLPAISPEGSESVTNAAECGDDCDRPVIGHVRNLLPFEVDKSWRAVLGWDVAIEVDVLIKQVSQSIIASDLYSIEQTLSYLQCHHSAERYSRRLIELKFVRNTKNELAGVSNVCKTGADGLTPYIQMVESLFYEKHIKLMKLATIPELPSLEHLKSVQRELQLKQPLGEKDLNVATEMVQIWSDRFLESVDELKMPNSAGMLVDIRQLAYNDMRWASQEKYATLHVRIPQEIADRLKIVPLSELARNGELFILDPDHDEFYQREEVEDRIRDTLDRYSRESTFHEYIANSDDCGSASAINFLLDETDYVAESVICDGLKKLQGPSLLIHNDGVFKEADFAGMQFVGRGSKRDDPSVIGKFGRDSQTMYHWTDVPMILSGKYLLILDPLRRHLPLDPRTRQTLPGIRVEYAKLKSTYPDQLAPFNGQWGFDSNKCSYDGTIFRFPLRKDGEESALIESKRSPDNSMAIQMFGDSLDEARLALLFLRNISVIDFSIKGRDSAEWSVRRGEWPETGKFSGWANISVETRNPVNKPSRITERWRRVMVDITNDVPDLLHRHKRRMKHVECGIAALVPPVSVAKKPSLQRLESRFFNCLPLKFESTLPVQVHATFLLSGDRQNIAIEETSRDAGSDWNKWLLEEKLPLVYLQFLEDIGREICDEVYRYFPVKALHRQDLLSDLVRSSFWREIASSTCRVFPVAQVLQGIKYSGLKVRNHRTAPNLVTFQDSIFDLEEEKFHSLRILLYGRRVNFIHPPAHLRETVRKMVDVKVMTPAIVRGILRSVTSNDVETVIRNDKEFLKNLLTFIMPKCHDDVLDLQGCPVLPLATGKVVALSLRTETQEVNNKGIYFLTSVQCRKIFHFASSIICTQEFCEGFAEYVSNSGLLNLKTMEKSDVHMLLALAETSQLEAMSKEWVYQFWDYMNPKQPPDTSINKVNNVNLGPIRHFPLVLVRENYGKTSIRSLHYFEINAVVVQSNVDAQMDIFKDFPDLIIAESRSLPRHVNKAEGSLSELVSLKRFLKGVDLLAQRKDKNLTEYIRECLKPPNVKTLQNIISKHLLDSPNDPEVPCISKNLPLWPSVLASHGYLTAAEALVAPNSDFIVPWMKDYKKFTISHIPARLQSTKITDLAMLEEYVLPNMPTVVENSSRKTYLRLIKAIARSKSLQRTNSPENWNRQSLLSLMGYRLAACQDGKLYHACDLFDHNNIIFRAAFSHKKQGPFLMQESQGTEYVSLWHDLGLRRSNLGKYKGWDYLACLEALEDKLQISRGPKSLQDIETVLSPLCTNSGSLCELQPSTWTGIARMQIFPVRQAWGNEPGYRRQMMQELTSQKKFMCLKEIVRYEFASVCWSQTTFALHEPSSFSSQSCGIKGQPSCAMVWRHLAMLANMKDCIEETDVEAFRLDVQRVYEYLSIHLEESQSSFIERNAAVWLNAEATSSNTDFLTAVKSSWIKIEDLLLDSPCDSPPMCAAQSFLGRYSTLLKALECKSIIYPEVTISNPNRSSAAFSLLRDLWHEEVLTDVVLEAEGRKVLAHKLILASRSSYCKTLFHGVWAAKSQSGNKNLVIKLEDMSHATLRILVEFCYEEERDWAGAMQATETDSPDTIANKLDDLLDVLRAADRWMMPDLHAHAQRQVMIGVRLFVRPDNVVEVQAAASEANAAVLKQYCAEFLVFNPEAILLANADSGRGSKKP